MVDNGTILGFDTLSDPPGIEIIDRLEQLRYQLHTPGTVSPEPVPTEQFLFPVGKGLRITTEELVLPNPASVIVRDGAGDMVAEVEHLDSCTLDEGSYILDLSTQIKTYMRVTGPVEITAEIFEIRFSFTEPTDVAIGFRSRHTRPAATITTTEAPVDVMAAVSQFGSALKSTTPERSFPTLRGHPPKVELGDTLDVPSGLERPETGIHIEVPPAFRWIYPVAPLAYYLGADVVPGSHPRLRTDSGFVHTFDRSGFERELEQTLKQVFLLDCLARTEGFYNVTLHERTALDEHVDLDWAALYQQPASDRLESYLDVPYDLLAEHVPKWRLVAHVDPSAETVEQLPFVVDDLAVVRTVESPTPAEPDVTPDSAPRAAGDTLTRSAGVEHRSLSDRSESDDEPYIQFEPTDSLEQGWIGDGVPIGASKLLREAFQNRLDREIKTGDISITIVLNDTRMDEERNLVDSAYGDRENLPFDVSIHRDLSVEELDETLREECDFLHYIGHADEEGFECPDGKLDAAALEHTGVDSFLLNACSSYHQGIKLIEAGAIGGIVTLTDIINSEAVSIGELIARLLNTGFPLRSALSIAREESILGGQYIVVGDGGMTVTQPSSRTPNLVEISKYTDRYSVEIFTYTTDTAGLGSIYRPLIKTNDNTYFLASGKLVPISVSADELSDFLEMEDVPVRINGDAIQWSLTLSLENL